MHNRNTRKRRDKGTEAIFDAIMTDTFPQINIRLQTTDLESLENIKQGKCKIQQKPNNDNINLYQAISCLNF